MADPTAATPTSPSVQTTRETDGFSSVIAVVFAILCVATLIFTLYILMGNSADAFRGIGWYKQVQIVSDNFNMTPFALGIFSLALTSCFLGITCVAVNQSKGSLKQVSK